MITLAQLVLDQHAAGQPTNIESVPPWQFRIRFADLAPICPNRIHAQPGRDFDRQRNALRVEIVPSNLARCSRKSPDGRGLAWVLSGGSPLSYRACCEAGCPRTAPPTPGAPP